MTITSTAGARAPPAPRSSLWRRVRYIEPPKSVEDEFVEMLANDGEDDGTAPADAFAAFAEAPKRQLAAALADVRALLDGPVLQARCLECGPGTVADSSAEREGFWKALVERLLG